MWLQPLSFIALIIIALTALSWPVAAIARRRYGAANRLLGADLMAYRLLRGFAWVTLMALAGWTSLLGLRTVVMENIDGRVWLLEIAGTLGGFGLAGAALWSSLRAWARPGGRVATLWSAVQFLAALTMLYVMLTFHLISFGTQF